MASRSVQPFFAQLTAESRYTSALRIAPSHWGIWTPLNTWFLGLSWVFSQNSIVIGSRILHCSQQSVFVLYKGPLFPSKMALFLRISGPLSNTLFLRPIRAHIANSIPIGSAVFAQLTTECLYLYFIMGHHFPVQNYPSHEEIWTRI